MSDFDTEQVFTVFAACEGGKIVYVWNDHDDAIKGIQPGQELYLLEATSWGDVDHIASCSADDVIEEVDDG